MAGSQSAPSHYRVPGSMPAQSMWNLC